MCHDGGLSMRSIVGTVLLVAALAGCSNDPFDPVEPAQGLPSKGPVDVKSFDPPTRFTADPAWTLEITTEASEVILHGSTAIAPIHGNLPLSPRSGEELRFVDARTGATKHSVTPSHPLPKTPVRAMPTLTTVGGRATVLMPFLVETPAEGTTPGRLLLEVVSVDADSGEVGWRVELPLDGWTPPGAGSNTTTEVSFAGVDGGVGVILLANDSVTNRKGDTYALDLASRRVLWHQAGFESSAVASGVVVGRKPGPGEYPKIAVLGLDVRTGQRKWASPRADTTLVRVHPAGPAKVAVDGSDGGSKYVEIVDIASGRTTGVRQGAGEANLDLTDCFHDGQSTVVCYDNGQWVSGLDVTTGEWTWTLAKSGGRLVPRVTGVWHGVVYGWVDNLRGVVLDAKTGADRETKPGTSPSVVNESFGIGPWPGGAHGSSIYPAIG
jgi:hypothetical protein